MSIKEKARSYERAFSLVCGGAENTLRTAGGMSDALLYDFMDAPTNIFQKIRRTLLGPIEILSRRDEADVPAPRGHFQRHGRIRFRNAVRIAIRRKERVVRGIDQQKGHINMLQKPQAAAFPPDAEAQWRLFRSLVNVRAPRPAGGAV